MRSSLTAVVLLTLIGLAMTPLAGAAYVGHGYSKDCEVVNAGVQTFCYDGEHYCMWRARAVVTGWCGTGNDFGLCHVEWECSIRVSV